jgi:hypothetical protein
MKIPKMIKIRCACGDELLLLPDLKETGKAIDDHIELHLQSLKAPSCTPAEAERLKDELITQIITVASQHDDEENQ